MKFGNEVKIFVWVDKFRLEPWYEKEHILIFKTITLDLNYVVVMFKLFYECIYNVLGRYILGKFLKKYLDCAPYF